jgi:hypothetical protein
MKYSLRSLFVVVTLVAVLLGGRIEYLRRWAVFHEREAARYNSILADVNTHGPDVSLSWGKREHHSQLAWQYRCALYRPWTIVRESP